MLNEYLNNFIVDKSLRLNTCYVINILRLCDFQKSFYSNNQYNHTAEYKKVSGIFFAEKSFIKLVKCAGFFTAVHLSYQKQTNNNLIWTEKIF